MNRQTILSVITMETIRQMGQLIAERFNPDKVILFGSYARGEGSIHSDVDLMVVMDSQAPRFERSGPIRAALSERWIEPIDVIVRSPRVFADRKNIPDTLEYEAATEGIMLHEKKRI
jgi:predicted nucleotidyltransferase